jgi:hypothetical protein
VEAFPAMYNTKNSSDLWKDIELPSFPSHQSCDYPSILPVSTLVNTTHSSNRLPRLDHAESLRV